MNKNAYELYEYKSDNFPESYNTPEGYQKIAFHVSCTNVSKTDILDGQKNKLYIDNANSKIYYYDGDFYVNIQ